MLQAKVFRSRILAIGWFLVMCVLFVLPGSSFPSENWLSQVHFDKWVHVGLFSVLLFLWLSSFQPPRKKVILFLVAAIAYGLLVEIVQENLVVNRSFDIWDWVSDIGGSLLGSGLWWRVYKKNKPL